ncbi:MAG: hypothetical protein E6I91_18920 [Chloroflexi bacterium]|nr:MAG: hypothetical protein E6I91_18920 [Chloroflexota bacterium]
MAKMRPLGDRVVVKSDFREETIRGGIIIPVKIWLPPVSLILPR